MSGQVLGSFVALGRLFIRQNVWYIPGARLVVVTNRKIPVRLPGIKYESFSS
jgi:hypothetical protein